MPAGPLVEVEELVLAPGPVDFRQSAISPAAIHSYPASSSSSARGSDHGGAQVAHGPRLQRVRRPPGTNDCGMVAWVMMLRTPEYPQGRQVLVVANDLTYQSGAFSPREDALF
ncbi:uncharacterized protein HaLaN_31713, partial [Haematococcus lacustris]